MFKNHNKKGPCNIVCVCVCVVGGLELTTKLGKRLSESIDSTSSTSLHPETFACEWSVMRRKPGLINDYRNI